MSEYVLVDEWLDYLHSKGRKELTTKSYFTKLRRCLALLELDGRSIDPRKITEKDLIYLNDVLGVSESSRHAYLKAVSDWCKWYTGEDILAKADFLWNPPSCPNRVFISNDVFSRLMETADARGRVILLLGGCMGLRNGEICELRYSDIQGGRMKIHGKGHGPDGKVEYMAIPPIVMSAIEEWRMESSHLRDESDGHIVVSVKAKRKRAISRSILTHLVSDMGKEIGEHVTPHSLRRLFATSLYRGHVDIADIKTLLRHESVDTTMRCYIQPDKERLDGIMVNKVEQLIYTR